MGGGGGNAAQKLLRKYVYTCQHPFPFLGALRVACDVDEETTTKAPKDCYNG